MHLLGWEKWYCRDMKPLFALSLSFEGISLLYRATDGWRAVGDVPLDVDDLPNALAELRHKADQLAGGPWHSKLIIPNDQIKYLTIDTGPLKGDARQGLIEAELANATPYALNELAFDLFSQGAVTHVAAVALETLAEAEAFACEHQFNPVSFVAIPESERFLAEPHFGETRYAAEQDNIESVEPDDNAVTVIGPALVDREPATSLPDPATENLDYLTEAEPAEAIQPKPSEASQTIDANADSTAPEVSSPNSKTNEPPTPAPGFSSRRRKTASGAPALDGASRSTPTTPVKPLVQPPEDSPKKSTVSVASPVLDLPPEPASAVAADQGDDAKSRSGFLSRRKPSADKKEQEHADIPQPLPFKAAAQDPEPPVDETERMTVFGARESQKVRGKPRFLGLMLTVALLFFLAAVAAWASLFLDDGVTGLFRGTPERTEIARQDPAQNDPEKTAETLKEAPAPATSPLADTLPPAAPEKIDDTAPALTTESQESLPAVSPAPSLPTLTDTDTAVLDALRQFPTEAEATQPETTATPETPIAPVDSKTDEARYAATGIWPNAPEVPLAPFIIDLDDVYVASIDRTDLSQDAVALPPLVNLETDAPINSVASPAAAGTAAVVDSRGLVDPTVDGAVTPDGVIVYLGRPPIVPPRTPTRFETTPDLSELPQEEYLAALRPRLRPEALVESNERARFGGKTRDELAKLRPKLRPKTEKQIAEEDETPTAQAVAVSPMPKTRPKNFAALVAKAKPKPAPTQTASTSTTAAAAASAASTADVTSGGITSPGRTGGSNVSNASVKPAAPSPSSVARQATLKNSINLKRLNLIGVYGTPSNRRALIRLPSGRYKKVKVGDLVDGGRVVGIGESELRYQKGSRSLTLKMPSG